MLAAVFLSTIPSISSDPVLRDLIRSFNKVEAPPRPVRPPAWDLSLVLRCLPSPLFEPLHLCSLRLLTKKVLFLVALATAKLVGELQAISRTVSFANSDACLSYVPEFVTKTESFSNPLPRSFLVKSLSDFAAGLEEDLLLCPVRALCIYLCRTDSFSPLPCRLFVSPRRPSHPLSKNAVSFFLRKVIMMLTLLGRRLILYVHIVSMVSRPLLLSIVIGRSPACWSLLPGGPVHCLPLFTFVISNTNLTTFVPWACLWLWVSRSVRSHLFPLRTGGGGEPSGPFFCMPCGSASVSGACSGACSTCSRTGSSIF